MFQTYLQTLFNEHKANETKCRIRFKAYKETYLEFKYDSLSTTLEDNFNISNFNQYEIGPSGKAHDF
jgi:hypothetical protein